MRRPKSPLYGWTLEDQRVHRLARLWEQQDGDRLRTYATFACDLAAPLRQPSLSTYEDTWPTWCPTCREARGLGRRVYVAELADGRIKVGSTIDVVRRMRQLDGHLVDSLGGSFTDESTVLKRIKATPVDGTREYFAAEHRDACLAALRSLLRQPSRAVAA